MSILLICLGFLKITKHAKKVVLFRAFFYYGRNIIYSKHGNPTFFSRFPQMKLSDVWKCPMFDGLDKGIFSLPNNSKLVVECDWLLGFLKSFESWDFWNYRRLFLENMKFFKFVKGSNRMHVKWYFFVKIPFFDVNSKFPVKIRKILFLGTNIKDIKIAQKIFFEKTLWSFLRFPSTKVEGRKSASGSRLSCSQCALTTWTFSIERKLVKNSKLTKQSLLIHFSLHVSIHTIETDMWKYRCLGFAIICIQTSCAESFVVPY